MSQAGRFLGGGGPAPGSAIETLTGNVGGAVGPDGFDNVTIIGAGVITVTGNPATHTLTITSTNASTDYYTDDGNYSTPDAGGRLNVNGVASTAGINIHTISVPNAGNNLGVALNDSLFFPDTNMAGTQGVLFWGGDTFLHNYGIHNTFLGQDAGNLTLTVAQAVNNTALGFDALTAVTTGSDSVGVGYSALLSATTLDFCVALGSLAGSGLTTGRANTALGYAALNNCITGEGNIALGALSATNYAGAESSNIIINNDGILGENNTIRIGIDGVAPGQQNATYIAGIYNRAFGSPSGVVQIDSTFKVGSSAGTDGQLLIGANGASPLWANITSAGGTIAITNGVNAINIDTIGGRAASQFNADVGTAIPLLGLINNLGGSNINTSAAGHTVTFNLNNTIFWPITNGAGTTGVIYLGNNRFMHDGGSITNSFLGNLAGNFTNTSLNNTGLGDASLTALTLGNENTCIGSGSAASLTTSGSNVAVGFESLTDVTIGAGSNTAVGHQALFGLIDGSDNIAIGASAGNFYAVGESNNIVIGNSGVALENQTIRIGSAQTSAYMAGIYNETVGATNAPVFIDNTGKLGTVGGGAGSNAAFSAYLNTTVHYANSTSVQRFLGADQVLTLIADNSGSFFIGDGLGTPASFTAPSTGLYQINLTIGIAYSGSGSVGTTFQIFVVTTARTYQSDALNSETLPLKTISFSVVCDMTAGDTAEFAWIASIVNSGGYNLQGGGPNLTTMVSGFKVF